MKIVIATSRLWNEFMVNEVRERTGHDVYLINRKEDLNLPNLEKIKPDYVFFPHWSFIIKPEIFENFECVIFHMTDLPFGRGGSPLQNLISRQIYHTKITALKCSSVLDGGPIYLKKPLELKGSAREIFKRASDIILDMILEIIDTRPEPQPQQGDPVEFSRRTPAESNIANITDLNTVYDFIRMLDADGYPYAFIQNEGLIYEFSDAELIGDTVTAKVKISRKKNV